MNLAYYTPATTVERLFDSFWSGVGHSVSPSTISPRVVVFDHEKTLVVEAEMPGVKKDDIQVSLERGVLTIKAEKKTARESNAKDYYVGERSFGNYERSFRVSEEIDADSIQAHFEDGVLRLEMQRKATAEGRKIEIK